METMNFKVGDKVLFGRTNGEQTQGTVVKVNRVKLKVRQDEQRGTMRAYPIGSVWTVPTSLCRKVGSAPVVEAPKVRRPESDIMRDILGVYAGLSPENLSCDGELPRSAVVRRAAALRSRLSALFAELGRKVDESEAFSYAYPRNTMNG